MKIIFTALTLVIAFNAHGADKKLGNVVAVERTLENVYDSCIQQITSSKDHDPKARYFACSFDVSKNSAEYTPGEQRLMTIRTTDCSVDAELKNSKIFVMFNGNENKAQFAEAKACFSAATSDAAVGNAFKYVIYTVE